MPEEHVDEVRLEVEALVLAQNPGVLVVLKLEERGLRVLVIAAIGV